MMDFGAHDRAIIEALQTKRDRQAALIERMAEALRPFSALAQAHNTGVSISSDRRVFGINGEYITVGDLRRARDILKELGQLLTSQRSEFP